MPLPGLIVQPRVIPINSTASVPALTRLNFPNILTTRASRPLACRTCIHIKTCRVAPPCHRLRRTDIVMIFPHNLDWPGVLRELPLPPWEDTRPLVPPAEATAETFRMPCYPGGVLSESRPAMFLLLLLLYTAWKADPLQVAKSGKSEELPLPRDKRWTKTGDLFPK